MDRATCLRLRGGIVPFTMHKQGDVVLMIFHENTVRHSYRLHAADLEACLLEGLTLSAGKDFLAKLEVASGECPLACHSYLRQPHLLRFQAELPFKL